MYGAVKYVQMCLGDGWAGVPKTTGRLVHTYNYAIVTYRNKSDAAVAQRALDGAQLLRSEALTIRFASGQAAAADDESENEFDESDLAPPDDSDGMDFDDFDDY